MPGELETIDVGQEAEPTGITRQIRPPREAWYSYLELKESWDDDWEWCPEAELLNGEAHTASMGGSRVQFAVRYGPKVRIAGEGADDAYVDRPQRDLQRWWVRVRLLVDSDMPDEDPQPLTIFVGRVESEVRDVGASQVTNAAGTAKAQGTQTWVALGPLRMLQKIDISNSYGAQSGSEDLLELGWLLSFNRPGAVTETLRGNRSTLQVKRSYLFGGYELWTHRDAVEYVLQRFVRQVDGNDDLVGPDWTLGGDENLLDEIKTRLQLGRTTTAESLLRQLIPTAYGLDFVVHPIEEDDDEIEDQVTTGFEVEAFALVSGVVPIGFDEYSYRPNRNLVKLNVSDTGDLACQIEETTAALYDAIHVEGDRIISCFSIGDGTLTAVRTLWTTALETLYKAGTGTPSDAPEKHDAARADDRYRNVYAAFAIDLDTFAYQGGAANPYIELDGTVTVSGSTAYQTYERKTLSELPLLEGVRWDTDPPTYEYVSDTWPGWRPLLVLVDEAGLDRMVPIDVLNMADDKYPGIAIEPLVNDWGFRLRCSPNHVLAKNHWAAAANSAIDPATEGVDYTTLVATIAIRTDHRLRLGVELPSHLKSGNGLVKKLTKPEATFGWLTANTIIGVDEVTGDVLHSPSSGTIVRDDRELVARMLAGAIARFFSDRKRAVLTQRFLAGWQALLGATLVSIEVLQSDGTDDINRQAIHSPITSVAWDFGQRMTRISTGQATR